METIFDHNITQEELEMLFLRPMTREKYLQVWSQDSAYADLYRLYTLRDQPEVAEEFLNRIKDEDLRLSIAMHDTFPLA